jgi:hypothetical protein
MEPLTGLTYVTTNIKTNFRYFLSDLTVNASGKIISLRYPSTEFMHEKDLLENPETKMKLIRRYERFIKIFRDEPCDFLYNIPS